MYCPQVKTQLPVLSLSVRSPLMSLAPHELPAVVCAVFAPCLGVDLSIKAV